MDTTRVYPGDGTASPVGKMADPDLGRARREEVMHRWMQTCRWIRQAQTTQRYVDSPPDPAPIPYVQRSPFYTFADPREAMRRAA